MTDTELVNIAISDEDERYLHLQFKNEPINSVYFIL